MPCNPQRPRRGPAEAKSPNTDPTLSQQCRDPPASLASGAVVQHEAMQPPSTSKPRRHGRKLTGTLAISAALLAVGVGAVVTRSFLAQRSRPSAAPFHKTELPIRVLEHIADDESGDYEIKVESLSTNRPGVGHYGWKIAPGPPRSLLGAEVLARELQLSQGACSRAEIPELSRAGVGAYLRRRTPRRHRGQAQPQIFAFTGILRGRGIEGVLDDANHVFFVVMACTDQCRVLPEYINRGAPAEILAFGTDAIGGDRVEVGMRWDSDRRQVDFLRDAEVWGQVPIDAPSAGFLDAKFDVAHFVPTCADGPTVVSSDVIFSDLVWVE